MKKVLFAMFVCFVIAAFSLEAKGQSVAVTGTVTDGSMWYSQPLGGGEPLPGAIVLIAGTNQGTIADLDGKYSIPVLYGELAKIKYSFIGFITEYKDTTPSIRKIDVVLRDNTVPLYWALKESDKPTKLTKPIILTN